MQFLVYLVNFTLHRSLFLSSFVNLSIMYEILLDLQSGYWQAEIRPGDTEKTSFSTISRLYKFTIIPFGLRNAPATFERLIDLVLRGLTLIHA